MFLSAHVLPQNDETVHVFTIRARNLKRFVRDAVLQYHRRVPDVAVDGYEKIVCASFSVICKFLKLGCIGV